MLDNNTVIVAAAVVVIISFLIMMMKPKRHSRAPPNVNVGLPLVGNFIEFGKNPVDFATTCYKKYGTVFTVPMMHKNLTFVMGPEASTPF